MPTPHLPGSPDNSAPAQNADHTAEPASGRPEGGRSVFTTAWNALTAVIGGVMGLLPHLLHHIGLLGGAALVTGATGNVLFAVIGLIFSLPLLRRLYRWFGTWKAPAVALLIFTLMFSLSAFVLGPAISGDDSPSDPLQTPTPTTHQNHDT